MSNRKDNEDVYARIAHTIHEGGWSSLYDLVSSLDDEFIREKYYYFFDEEDDDQDEPTIEREII